MKYSGILWISLIILFFTHIGTRPLANPDEGRYASIGLDMLHSNNWIVPRLNGLIYFEKPPLAYWTIALGQKIFGENLWGTRFFNALFSLLTCFVLYSFCKKFLSKSIGLWAVLIYGTSGLPFGMSQMLTLDNTLTFFLTSTLLLFASGFLEENSSNARRCFLYAYIFMASTVMTKGLIGIVLPGIIGIPWLIYTGYIKKLPRMHLIKGLTLFFLIAAPWHILVQQSYAVFSKFYFWHEHFERYLTSKHNRTEPFYFLPNSFLLGSIPWVFFLPRSFYIFFKAKRTNLEKNIILFSIFWSVIILTFFSISNSQLIPYILPAISGITILLAYGLSKIDLNNIRFECFIWALLFFITPIISPRILANKVTEPLPVYLQWLFQILLFSGSISAFIFLKPKVKLSFYILLSTTYLIYLLLPIYLPHYQRLCGVHVCQEIRQRSPKNVDVFCAFNYFNDLPFYLKQPIGTINCVPEEHQLGFKTEGCNRYLNISQFYERWTQPTRCYAVIKKGQEGYFESYMSNFSIYHLTQDHHFSLYSNQP